MRPKADPERIGEQMRVFGQNMRTARKARGLAQDNPRLKQAKLDKAMVSYLELGERSPRLTTILRVARVLGVTPQALLEGIGTNAAVLELPPARPDLVRAEARFGANLRWVRKREGVSQMELGGEANIHRVGVGAIERGERSPKLHTILKLAWTLELPAAVLLHGVQDDHGPGGASGAGAT
jgi:transcriptional regulator with XRE-family HTH domain